MSGWESGEGNGRCVKGSVEKAKGDEWMGVSVEKGNGDEWMGGCLEKGKGDEWMG